MQVIYNGGLEKRQIKAVEMINILDDQFTKARVFTKISGRNFSKDPCCCFCIQIHKLL